MLQDKKDSRTWMKVPRLMLSTAEGALRVSFGLFKTDFESGELLTMHKDRCRNTARAVI
jgi:hypothetical protein